MQAALEATWPYVEELFDPTDIADQLAALPGIAVDPADPAAGVVGLRRARCWPRRP